MKIISRRKSTKIRNLSSKPNVRTKRKIKEISTITKWVFREKLLLIKVWNLMKRKLGSLENLQLRIKMLRRGNWLPLSTKMEDLIISKTHQIIDKLPNQVLLLNKPIPIEISRRLNLKRKSLCHPIKYYQTILPNPAIQIEKLWRNSCLINF